MGKRFDAIRGAIRPTIPGGPYAVTHFFDHYFFAREAGAILMPRKRMARFAGTQGDNTTWWNYPPKATASWRPGPAAAPFRCESRTLVRAQSDERRYCFMVHVGFGVSGHDGHSWVRWVAKCGVSA